jgi:anti-sigma factor ChrR (cupin superfamily)
MTGKKHPDDEHLELAALHALGALPAGEARAFEDHLRLCPECALEERAVREALAEEAKAGAVSPPPALRARLLARLSRKSPDETHPPADAKTQVWKRWERGGRKDLQVVRAGEGAWEPTAAPGVSVKPLSVDPERRYVTMLVRMQAGSSYPRHRHAGAEECFVLEGDLRVGDEVLHAGDYQRAEGGSLHGVQSTDNGCLLLIVSSQEDELV